MPERSRWTTLRPCAAIVALSTSRSSAADLDGGNMILRLVNSWLQHNNAKLGESRLGALVGSWTCARTAALEVARHRAAAAMSLANHDQELMHKDLRRV